MFELKDLPTFFRCKKCLSVQKIINFSFPDNNIPMNYIYIITVCQNNHYENKKIKNFDELQYKLDISIQKCSSCNLSPPLYYCLKCFKIFYLNCKEIHAAEIHKEMIKLKYIDNICFKHPFEVNNNIFKSFFECKLCSNWAYLEDKEEYFLSEFECMNNFFDFLKNNFLNNISEIKDIYRDDNTLLSLLSNYEERINSELNFIQKYYNQMKNIMQKKEKLNIIYYNNLKRINIHNFVNSFNELDYNELKLLFSIGHLFGYTCYALPEGINYLTEKKEGITGDTSTIKILTNNQDFFNIKNNFKNRPQELKYEEILFEINIREIVALDAYKNIQGVPTFIFSLKNKIYLMNLNTRKIEKELEVSENNNIDNPQEEIISYLKYYNFNDKEYILCQIKETKIIIFEIQQNFEKIFTLQKINIRSCLIFSLKNKLFLFISFHDKVHIYNFVKNSHKLITSIFKKDILDIEQIQNIRHTDTIFIDKKYSLYIIISNKKSILSLKHPIYRIYQEYKNVFPEKGIPILPKVYEFGNKAIYLMVIFDSMLNIYDFHTGDIIREVHISSFLNDYFFYNQDSIIFISDSEASISLNPILDINTGELNDDGLWKTIYIMKQIYLDDCEESIIYIGHYNNIILLSSKQSNIEKSKIIDEQLKEEKMKNLKKKE